MFVVAPIVVLQPSCRGCVTRSVLLGLDCCCCSICLTGMGLLFIYWLLLLPLSEGDYFFNLLFVVATIVCWGGCLGTLFYVICRFATILLRMCDSHFVTWIGLFIGCC